MSRRAFRVREKQIGWDWNDNKANKKFIICIESNSGSRNSKLRGKKWKLDSNKVEKKWNKRAIRPNERTILSYKLKKEPKQLCSAKWPYSREWKEAIKHESMPPSSVVYIILNGRKWSAEELKRSKAGILLSKLDRTREFFFFVLLPLLISFSIPHPPWLNSPSLFTTIDLLDQIKQYSRD